MFCARYAPASPSPDTRRPNAHRLHICDNACLKTVWPSGLRRWLQAPVRKGVGSNPTGVTCLRARLCSVLLCRRVRRGALRCGAMSWLGVLCEAVACRVMPCMCVHVCAWPRAVYTWCGAWGRAPACFSGGVSCDTGPLGRGILRTPNAGLGLATLCADVGHIYVYIHIHIYVYIYIYIYICIYVYADVLSLVSSGHLHVLKATYR